MDDPLIVLGQSDHGHDAGVYLAAAAGKEPASPRRGRITSRNRLVKMGCTSARRVLIVYLICGALGVLAMYLTQAGVLEGYAVGGATALAGAYFIYRLEKVGPLTSAPPPTSE